MRLGRLSVAFFLQCVSPDSGSNATWRQKLPTNVRTVASRCASSLWISLKRDTTAPACLVTSQERLPQSGLFAIQPPSDLNFERTSEWPAWSIEFDDYRFASRLNKRSEEAQVRTLLYIIEKTSKDNISNLRLAGRRRQKIRGRQRQV